MAFCLKCGSTIVDGACPQCSASEYMKGITDFVYDILDQNATEPVFDITDGVLESYIGNLSDVVLPDDVRVIDNNAFHENRLVKNLVIPEGVVEIRDGVAFCESLDYSGAFYKCKGLTEVSFPKSLRYIGKSAFSHSGLLSVSIPSGVDKIGTEAFRVCDSLKEVELSSGINTIGREAFSWCTSLERVVFPDSLVSVESGAFIQCMKLKEVVWPRNLLKLGSGAFSDCSDLTSVVIPKSLKIIPSCAFLRCYSLQELIIPEGVEVIEDSAFADCKSLKTVKLPESLKNLSPTAFTGCDKDLHIDYPSSINTNAISRVIKAHKALYPNNDGMIINIDGKDYCYGNDSIELPLDLIYCGYYKSIQSNEPNRKMSITKVHLLRMDTFKARYLGSVSKFDNFTSDVDVSMKAIKQHLAKAGINNYSIEAVSVPVLVKGGFLGSKIVKSGELFRFIHIRLN